ncbi:MAG: septation protein SepH [Jatrophihabitantaceae bacterium]
MRLLRLVGPGEDGTSLIVEAVETGSLDGERFALSLDDRLRNVANAQPETPAQTPAESSGPVPTPREIQVRVRAGETAQAVADQAGIPLERVMRFAFPVLQERVRVTDEARRARARRGGDGLLVPFGELLDSRLARHGVDPTSVRWDAYRREDGGWTVTSAFSSHERSVLAKWSFALVNRTVSALDDIAADLLSDRPVQALLPPPPAPEPVADSADADWAPEWDAAPGPRLTAVPNPGRADLPRQQEAGAAVRPPSRRQKAHTRPVPIQAEDELFDQDAFEQQPWHESPLPFEAGSGRGGASSTTTPPRHRAQRPAGQTRDANSDAGTLAEPAVAAVDPGLAESELAESTSPGSVEQPNVVPAEDLFVPAEDLFVPAEDLFERASSSPANPRRVSTATAIPTPAAADQGSDADQTGDTDAVSARVGGGDSQSKRGRRAGEKPRMPSWDDILLGVRHKSD